MGFFVQDHRTQFQFGELTGALGPAGVVASLNWRGTPLLPPSFRGERTDRVLQWTWWSHEIRTSEGPTEENPSGENRYNLTQAGTFGDGDRTVAGLPRTRDTNGLSPTHAVNLTPMQATILASPRDQWRTPAQSVIQHSVGSWTQYRWEDPILWCQTKCLIGPLIVNGRELEAFPHLYVESWCPFSATVFDAVIVRASEWGSPQWWYRVGQNVPTYPRIHAPDSDGAVILTGPSASPALAVLYGRTPARPDGDHVLNMMDWNSGPNDRGVAVLPGVDWRTVRSHRVVDRTVGFFVADRLDEGFMETLRQRVSMIPSPTVYDLPGELAPVLEPLLTSPGVRIATPIPWVEPVPSPPPSPLSIVVGERERLLAELATIRHWLDLVEQFLKAA